MEKILRGLLSKAYNLTDGEITALLENAEKDEAATITALLAKDADRVKKLTPKEGETFQDGYKKGKKESLTDLEKKAKEKYGVETDRTGLELIDDILEAKKPADDANKGTLTDDDVKRHKVYQDLEKRAKTELKAAQDAATTKVTELEKGFKKKETLAVVKSKALSILNGLEPVLEENEQVATNRKNAFTSVLDGYEFDLQGDNVVVSKDGKVLDDGHGNTKAFDALVKEQAANHFVFKNNNGGENSGNKNDASGKDQLKGKTGYPAKVTAAPKTLDELSKITNDKVNYTLEERQQTMKAYQEENGGQ